MKTTIICTALRFADRWLDFDKQTCFWKSSDYDKVMEGFSTIIDIWLDFDKQTCFWKSIDSNSAGKEIVTLIKFWIPTVKWTREKNRLDTDDFDKSMDGIG